METALRTGQTVLWVALTYGVARNAVWPYIVRTVPAKYRKLHESRMEVELRGGGRIKIGSLDQPDNLRGMGTDICLMVIDEAAFTRDYDLENVIDPMRLDNRAPLLALSSPNGAQGWFHRYYLMGQEPGQREVRSFAMPTWTNPTLPNIDAEMRKKKARIPDLVFRQEYAAEFVEAAGQVFRNVRPCEVARRREVAGRPVVEPGARYYVGIDFARTGADYTVVIVLEKLADGTLRLVWMERWGREEDEAQVDRLAALIQHFSPVRVLGEENNFGGVYVNWMRSKHRVAIDLFKTTAESKGPLVLQGAACFEFSKIEIWPEAEELGGILIGELLSYRREVTASGHYTYSAPTGLHDDCVIALLLAIRAAEGDPAGDAMTAGHFEGGLRDWTVRGWQAPARAGEGFWQ